MKNFKFKGLFLGLACGLLLNISSVFALSDLAKSLGFVELNEIDSTILSSLRYFTEENFLGTQVDGYKKNTVVMTVQCAQALKKVQEEVKKDGYCLVVYDAYRPQKAVNHFVKWALDAADQKKKDQYYPRVDKANVFDLGYIAMRSGHSRGSTVDLTIIKDGRKPHSIRIRDRKLLDGYTVKYLNDGTINMGTSFDLFDVASHFENEVIRKNYKKNREYLKNVMEKNGFVAYANEWWHFTLKDEPYAKDLDTSYFDFDIE